MEFCAERDSPNKGGRRNSRAAFLLCRLGKSSDGQKAQINPDGNPTGSPPDRSRNADGRRIVEAQSSAGKVNTRTVAQPGGRSEETLSDEAAQHAEKVTVQSSSRSIGAAIWSCAPWLRAYPKV
jgi:hypothetical protein